MTDDFRPATPDMTITVSKWTDSIQKTRFPQYFYDATAYTYGGYLDAYRKTWAGYTLGSIESYGSRYTQYRDVRSTYMWKDVTSFTSGGWFVASSYNGISNPYNSTNQEGRSTLDVANGYFKPNVNSTYLLWTNLYIPNVPLNMTAVMSQILVNVSPVSPRSGATQNVNLVNGQSVNLRTQQIVAYRNGASIPYSVRYKLLFTGPAPDTMRITLGYTELVGGKTNCGRNINL
jgi:hypothetical protein